MKQIKRFSKHTIHILKDAKSNFQQNEPIVYSAAIAFFAIFSLPAILIVLTLFGTVFFSEETVKQEIVGLAESMINDGAGRQVDVVLDNVLTSPSGFWEIFIAVIVVLKGASIIFFIMQKALNTVWQVKVKPDVKYLTFIRHRLITLGVVAGLGLLLLLSLILDTALSMYNEQIYELFEEYFTPALRAINTLFYLFVILVFFTSIHKVLPDAKVDWRDAFAGGFITSVLFLIGKQVINFILSSIKVVGIYAAAGSLVVVLLWIFYSSVILMLGAEVTKAYADNHGRSVEPSSIAIKYRNVSDQKRKV